MKGYYHNCPNDHAADQIASAREDARMGKKVNAKAYNSGDKNRMKYFR